VPLTRDEVDAFLSEVRLCHFATIDDRGAPRVRPLWYLWRDGSFWLTTRLEARHTGRDLANGGRATASIASDQKPYRAVIATGPIKIIGKDEGLLRDISFRYGDESQWLALALNEVDRTVLKLTPSRLLSWNYARGDYRRQQSGESLRTRL
jgi:nitroimidazol reductase NimA-like FMN-containing flavoprotein (pyridoxamine 5'-phosphate oxidase superfamily)